MPSVSYQVLVDDVPMEASLLARLQGIEVEDHAGMAGMLRLRLAVAVAEDGSRWSVVDDDPFPRLTPVGLRVGVGGETMEPLIDAHVVETRVRFSDEPGGSQMEVVAMDGSILLDLEERVRAWPDMADGDIASAIFSEAGLVPDVEDTQPTRQEVDGTTIQRGTDMQFLQHLAHRNGFLCYVETEPLTGQATGHFHPPRLDDEPQGILTVNLGEATNVRRFEARHHMLEPVRAAAATVDDAAATESAAHVGATRRVLLGGTALADGPKPRQVLVDGTGLDTQQELELYAQGVVDRAAWAIEAEGEVDPLLYGGVLRAKRPVLVRGVGRRFSGAYHVERVLHTFSDDGYSQRFTLRRNALDLTGEESFVDLGGLSL